VLEEGHVRDEGRVRGGEYVCILGIWKWLKMTKRYTTEWQLFHGRREGERVCVCTHPHTHTHVNTADSISPSLCPKKDAPTKWANVGKLQGRVKVGMHWHVLAKTWWEKLVHCQCIGENGASRASLCKHSFIVNHHGLAFVCFQYK